MKAKLIKTGNDYLLKEYGYGETLAITSGTMEGRKLSLKNCQAIKRGYDLDELAEDFIRDLFGDNKKEIDLSNGIVISFIKGFQKALEILGDKKFSEEDMKQLVKSSFYAGLSKGQGKNKDFDIDKYVEEHLEQQTEWDVEIVCLHTGDTEHTTNTGLQKLDADGCLILKRIYE